MGPTPLTDTKAYIVTLREEKVTIKKTCNCTGQAKSTGMALLAAACHLPPNKIPQYKPRARPKSKTSTNDHLLKKAVTKNPCLTTH